MSSQANSPIEKSPTTLAVSAADFGSNTWYARRWQGHWQAVRAEIKQLEQLLEQSTQQALRMLTLNDTAAPSPDQSPKSTKPLALPWHYLFLKQIEAAAVTQSLHIYTTALFEFFTQGFYAADMPGHATGNKATMERTVVDADITADVRAITQILHTVKAPHVYASKRYSPNFVLRTLVEQTYHDLNLLRQIYVQRSAANRQTVSTFLIAEELGRRALAPATATLFGNRIRNVLCYLGNRLEVRLLPYEEVVLMGAPQIANSIYSETQQAWMVDPIALTAIPHEIGHVLFRFGQFPMADGKIPVHRLLQHQLLAAHEETYPTDSEPPRADWRLQWLEEIFADAYSCLIAGPISVLGFQIMLADGLPLPSEDHLGEQHGAHPIPILRPLLQSRILRKIDTPAGKPLFPTAPDRLDERWQQWVVVNWPAVVASQHLGATNDVDLIGKMHFVIAGQRLNGTQILDALEPIIDVALALLTQVHPASEAATWTPHWQPAADTPNLAALYQHFVDFTDQIAGQALDAAGEAFAAYDGPKTDNQTLLDLLRQFQDEGIDGRRAQSGGIDSLIELLLFDGWSEEGPSAGHMGG